MKRALVRGLPAKIQASLLGRLSLGRLLWLGSALSSCAPAQAPAAAPGERTEPVPAGRAEGVVDAPDFELDTLEGKSLRLGEYLGTHVVLVDFWATYCDPCLVAMPALDGLYRKYAEQGFVVLGVAIDGPESIAQVRGEVQKLGVSFPILLDHETRVVSLYNPKTSAPYSVLIGRHGGIVERKEGYTPGDVATLERSIQRELGR